MITLRRTCYAMPEQYDAFDGDERVGYLRLRHGSFSVECPWVDGDVVYTSCPNGDGMFEDDERDRHLRFAVDAIQRWQRGEWPADPPDVEFRIVE